MAKRRELFVKPDGPLNGAQYRAVARLRNGDAHALRDTGQNSRAAGAMYLAGFVVECLLKSEMLRAYPWLAGLRSADNLPEDRRKLWALCYRSHDIEQMVARLPLVQKRVAARDQLGGGVGNALQMICARWTVEARYSTARVTVGEAAWFLSKIEEIRKCLES